MVEKVTTYVVKAVRDDGWWVLTVPDVPGANSQVRRLTQYDEYAREAVAFVLGVAPDSFDLRLEASLSDDVDREVYEARQAAKDADAAIARAGSLSRHALRRLLDEQRLTGSEAALVLGVTKQRVSQLAQGNRRERGDTSSALPSHSTRKT